MYKNRNFDEKLQKFVKSKKNHIQIEQTQKIEKLKKNRKMKIKKKMKNRKKSQNRKIEKSQLNFRAQNQA